MRHLSLFKTGLLLALAGVAFAHAVEKRPPNIVLILADDLGYRDVGFQNGDGFIETPNIDRLSKQGMVFTDAYAGAANCAPSRACLMSGQYTPRHGVYAVGTTDRGPMDQARLTPVPNREDLAPEIVTMAEALQARGYATGHFGKWHLGNEAQGAGPSQQGFSAGGVSPPKGKGASGSEEFDPKAIHAISQAACEFMTANKEKPFFAYIAHHGIHGPLEAKPGTLARFKDKAATAKQPHVSPLYAACTYDFDAGVGEVLNKLDELGLVDNTVVVFTSDNGGTPASINEPLRGAKGAYYEAGIREPFTVRWPGVVKAGSTCKVPIINQDLYPTFLKIAGAATLPSQLDGADLTSLLKGKGGLNRESIFWQFPGYLDRAVPRGRDPVFRTRPVTVIRKGDWKLFLYHEEWLLDGGKDKLDSNGAVELYNLREDLSERHDLARRNKTKRDELLGDVLAWLKRTGAPMPALKQNPPPPAERRSGDAAGGKVKGGSSRKDGDDG